MNTSDGPPLGLGCQAPHLLCSPTLLQALLEGMKRAGYGRIINVISIRVRPEIEAEEAGAIALGRFAEPEEIA